MLEVDGGSASGGVLLLVSDGAENVAPLIANVDTDFSVKGSHCEYGPYWQLC